MTKHTWFSRVFRLVLVFAPAPASAPSSALGLGLGLGLAPALAFGLALGAAACSPTPADGPDDGAAPRVDAASAIGRFDRDGGMSPVESAVDAAPSSRGTFALRVESVRSSSITLGWDPPAGATGYDVLLGAEPGPDDTLPNARLVGTAPADATGITLDSIAAGVDAFVRVEARVPGRTLWAVAHARTVTGARAALETPLRRVHGYGPNVLALVLSNPNATYDGGRFEGDLGASWQGGTWTVERGDGSPIGVRAVHRNTLPVSQPAYPVGYERWPDDTVVDLEHEIYLVLDAPFAAASDVLRVRHTGGGARLDVLVPVSDRYLETPLVKLNQVGYNPRASRRWAYVSGFMGTGGAPDLGALPPEAEVLVEPLDPLSPRRPRLTGLAIAPRMTGDDESAGEVRQIDLADVPAAEGVRYRIRIPGVGVSFPTAVSEEAALRAFYVAARGMYHNRWCGDLSSDHTEWSRPADHCRAYFVSGTRYRADKFAEDTPRTNEQPLRGGHHDAGDFDIRPYHVVVAQYLLRAFEMDPRRFSDGQLSLPESGNGIPDLLDEALWSVAAWQALERPDGAIRAGVESYRHPAGIYKANDDALPYWTFDPEPWHTAYVAALFAQAARLVRPFDAAKSAELASAARAAYASPITASAPAGMRLYAASELSALTAERRYADDFTRLYRSGAFDDLTPMQRVYPGYFESGGAMADFVMGYATSPGADPSIVASIRDTIRARADAAAARVLDSVHAHRNGREAADPPDWGHASSTGRHVDLVYQALELGGLSTATAQRYLDALSVSADYALGANPWGRTYLTGLGSAMPNEPLHNDSLAFLKEGMPPVPGIPIYGPIQRIPAASYYDPVETSLEPTFDARPLGLRVLDTRTAVNSSEFTIWESQAPFAELFGALIAEGATPPATWLPGGAEHRATLPGQYAE